MRPLVKNRDAALYLGLGAFLLGAILLHDAYEARNVNRPKAMKVLGLIG